jgi:hypothetical protein
MLISTALLLDSNIRNSVCTPAKLPCRRVEVGYEKITSVKSFFFTSVKNTFNTVSYKEQFLIKLASTKNVTFNVSCIKKCLLT